jgi:hypothetical protein
VRASVLDNMDVIPDLDVTEQLAKDSERSTALASQLEDMDMKDAMLDATKEPVEDVERSTAQVLGDLNMEEDIDVVNVGLVKGF